ncbi:MAG: 50S ribosomal protein L6 [Planctomycetes bacterium]|nr:50S ribosomal protein L6 [Planctomycetota bacterium]
MSRIGKTPVSVPVGVDIKVDGAAVTVKGPKGTLALTLHAGITVAQEGNSLELSVPGDRRDDLSAFWGLDRALLANCVTGVSKGFEKKLEIHGTGYSAKLVGDQIELTVGFSHVVNIPIPSDLTIELPQPDRINITGIDKQKVGELAAVIRRVRKPEPYKGKGIRYADEVVRRKAGKTMGAVG